MIIISGLSSIFQSKKIAFLSLLVLLGLLIVSVWDSVLIIDTYVNDNRITLVKTVDIGENDTLPYLENLFLGLGFDSSLIFPGLPDFDQLLTETYYSRLKEEVLNGSFLLENVNISNVDDRVRMIAIFTKLAELDVLGFWCAMGDKDKWDCVSDKAREKYGWLSRNTRSLSLLVDLEKKLGAFIMPNLFMDGTSSNFSDYFFIDSLTSGEFGGELAISSVLKGKGDFSIWIGIQNSTQNVSSSMAISIATKSVTFEQVNVPSRKYCYVKLKVDNVGVFDKSATIACRNETDRHENNWNRRAFLESSMKQCGCVPFSFKTHFFTIVGSDAIHPPACDVEAYYRCSNMTTELNHESSTLPVCVKPKNQYQFLFHCEDDDCLGGESRICPLATLYVQSSADFYAVYAERYQMTPTQFVGQLGGDIGLYTGLSILSVWQLLLYLYNKYCKFKSVYKHPPPENKSAASIRLMFYKAFVVSLFKNIEESMVNVGQDDHQRQGDEETGEMTVEQRLCEMERMLDFVKDLAEINERQEAMETGLEMTNHKLDRLESIAMKTERTLQDILKGEQTYPTRRWIATRRLTRKLTLRLHTHLIRTRPERHSFLQCNKSG